MQALYVTDNPKNPLVWREARDPELAHATDAIIKPLAVAACDLDRAIVAGQNPFPAPFMFGHEFTGKIVALGDEVCGFALGDIVLASFQPSCGTCPTCQRQLSSVCAAVPNGTMYGIGETGGDWGGAFSEAIRVPWAAHNLIKLDASLDPRAIASASDNLADGLRGVDGPLRRNPGASILIAGRGSIPLYAAICARHLAASDISVASDDEFVLSQADKLGFASLPVTQWPKRFASHDITVDCTNRVEGLSALLKSTAPFGECTSSSIFFAQSIEVPMFNMNMKGITFHTGRVNSASNLARVMSLLQEGLDPEQISPAYWPMQDAVEAFATEPFSRKLILSGA